MATRRRPRDAVGKEGQELPSLCTPADGGLLHTMPLLLLRALAATVSLEIALSRIATAMAVAFRLRGRYQLSLVARSSSLRLHFSAHGWASKSCRRPAPPKAGSGTTWPGALRCTPAQRYVRSGLKQESQERTRLDREDVQMRLNGQDEQPSSSRITQSDSCYVRRSLQHNSYRDQKDGIFHDIKPDGAAEGGRSLFLVHFPHISWFLFAWAPVFGSTAQRFFMARFAW